MTLGDIGTFFSRLSTGNLLMPLTSSTDSPQQPSSLASQEAEASLIRLRTPSFGSITQNITLAPPQRQTLTLVHTNDVHARFDEFNDLGLDCKAEDIAKNNCFGGIARIGYSINKIRKEKQNVLLFDAGDEFTGTMVNSA